MTPEEIKSIRIEDYDYPLPEERIALHPCEPRDACRLLVAGAGQAPSDRPFADLPALLEEGSLMVCNNTRVINARLLLRRDSGARIEVFLLEPSDPSDYALAFQAKGRCRWTCLVGNLRRWKGDTLSLPLVLADGSETVLRADLVDRSNTEAVQVELSWDGDASMAEVIDAAGRIPIPPYLNRDSEDRDLTDYQTVYSRIRGSVAAPTAGLHFTDRVLADLGARGIDRRELTLHVGAGTFKPVKAATIGQHPMHTEVFTVGRSLVEALVDAKRRGAKLVAVGTTTVRTLESLPRLAQKLLGGESPHVGQWDDYDPSRPLKGDELEALAAYMAERGIDNLTASTAIMIAPGFEWKVVDRLVTNFHHPQSTLLLLVSSFLGEAPGWRPVYDHALRSGYRFLSYGDACLFSRP